MQASEYLKKQAASDWRAATAHPYANALANGALEQEKMTGYMRRQPGRVWEGPDQAARDAVQEMFVQAVSLMRVYFDAAWVGFKVQR